MRSALVAVVMVSLAGTAWSETLQPEGWNASGELVLAVRDPTHEFELPQDRGEPGKHGAVFRMACRGVPAPRAAVMLGVVGTCRVCREAACGLAAGAPLPLASRTSPDGQITMQLVDRCTLEGGAPTGLCTLTMSFGAVEVPLANAPRPQWAVYFAPDGKTVAIIGGMHALVQDGTAVRRIRRDQILAVVSLSQMIDGFVTTTGREAAEVAVGDVDQLERAQAAERAPINRVIAALADQLETLWPTLPRGDAPSRAVASGVGELGSDLRALSGRILEGTYDEAVADAAELATHARALIGITSDPLLQRDFAGVTLAVVVARAMLQTAIVMHRPQH